MVTTAGDFVAKSYETFQAGVNKVTWLVDKAGEQLLVVGSTFVDATLSAAKGFMDQLEKFGKAFTDLWWQLAQFKDAATQVLQAIVTDPGELLQQPGGGGWPGTEELLRQSGYNAAEHADAVGDCRPGGAACRPASQTGLTSGR